MDIQNLSLSFGLEQIYQGVSLHINEFEKVGIIGVNGAGKTTLFRILLNEITPDSGEVHLPKDTRIAYLPQIISDDVENMEMTVFDYLLSGRPIAKLNEEKTSIYEKLAENPDQKDLLRRLGQIEQELTYWEEYDAESILLKLISGMHIDDDILLQPLSSLSGGQKSKVAFARLLYSKPEMILLDEPTNHLDEESREYVINFLKSYHGTVFVISHDTKFLDEITTCILFIDKRKHKMKLYRGDYTHFKKVMEEEEKNILLQIEREEKEVKKLRDIVLLYSNSSGKRKRMAQDREKKLNKLLENKTTLPPKEKVTKMKFTSTQKGGLSTLKVYDVSFGYQKDHPLFQNLTFELYRNERFLIVGYNGVGKSTLLKLIVDKLTPDQGEIKLGTNVKVAYYAQEHEGLDNEKTILENFEEFHKSEKEIRNALGNFLFYGDDVFKKIKVLSPGERSRVALAKLVLTGANFLILDEPTNHLDPETQEIIAQTFHDYEGTILVVSHNPDFVDHIGIERLLHLPSGEITYYDHKMVEHYKKMNER